MAVALYAPPASGMVCPPIRNVPVTVVSAVAAVAVGAIAASAAGTGEEKTSESDPEVVPEPTSVPVHSVLPVVVVLVLDELPHAPAVSASITESVHRDSLVMISPR